MRNHINKNVLVTTASWFIAPDGRQYKAIWGKLIDVHEAGKTLGFIPNRAHANWFVEIGDTIVMGCQVLYFIVCENEPNFNRASDWTADGNKGLVEYETPTKIYNANEKK